MTPADVSHPKDLAAGLCGCGCKTPIDALRPDARYANDACRTRDWKRRVGYVDRRRAKTSRNAPRSRVSTVIVHLPDLASAGAVRNKLRTSDTTDPAEVAGAEAIDRAITNARKRGVR